MTNIRLGHLDPPRPQLYNDKLNSTQREERRGDAENRVAFPQADSWRVEEGFPFPFPQMTIIDQLWSPTEGLITHSPPLPLQPCVWNRSSLCSSILARNSPSPLVFLSAGILFAHCRVPMADPDREGHFPRSAWEPRSGPLSSGDLHRCLSSSLPYSQEI